MLSFGTDGVRGVAFDELTVELVRDLGRAVARVLGPSGVVIGRDTRRSGPALEAALVQGVTAEGVPVHLLGVAPTPAVAYVAERHDWAGIAVTASHNPWQDNGIKVFGVGGRKLADGEQIEIERQWHAINNDQSAPGSAKVTDASDLVEEYVEHRVSVLGSDGLRGLTVVLDCGNGAMSDVAPRVFTGVGASVIVHAATPDGININNGCGATDPSDLSRIVVDNGADLGLAFDGDGDRIIAVDATGSLVNGDQLLAMAALDLAARGLLRNRAVAVTVMTNLGFHRSMAEAEIGVVVTPVGDRAILQALDEHDLVLGGEQSGHLIFRAHATTGDGLLAGLFLCDTLRRNSTSLRDAADASMQTIPQVLVNVPVHERVEDPAGDLAEEISAISARLGSEGRVLVRASGTEPLVRVMVEAVRPELATIAAEHLREAVERRYQRDGAG